MDEEMNVAANDTEELAIPSIESGNDDVESTSTEVTPESTETTNNNDVTQTQAFSQRLKEQTQRGIDAHYEQLYGESHNVHSQADYDYALQQQQQQEEAETQRQEYESAGIDSDMMNRFIDNNPSVKQANQIIAEQKENSRIEGEINDLFEEYPDARNQEIPESVFLSSIEHKIPLLYAYSRYANKNATTMAEQKTLRGLQQNGQTSPGSLGGSQTEEKATYSNMPSKDFNSLVDRVLKGEKIKL